MADDDTTNDLPSNQDVDDNLSNPESDGDESSEVRVGDDALVDEGVIENKPSSEDPPETECPPCKGALRLGWQRSRTWHLAHGFLCFVT